MKEYMLLAYPKYPSSYGDPESFVICNSQVMDHYRINRGNLHPALEPIKFESSVGLKLQRGSLEIEGCMKVNFIGLLSKVLFRSNDRNV
mgnify:CR=1 FL=1